MNYSSDTRASGILAHITSLPSPFGTGDIGHSAYSFLDFLQESGQHLWQFLPTGPTNPVFDNSPYMTTSAFAGSPLLLSPELLAEDGLLDLSRITVPDFSEYLTSFEEVDTFKKHCLNLAFNAFNPEENSAFQRFKKETAWLHDYCLFMTFKKLYKGKGWFEWPAQLACRDAFAMADIAEKNDRQMNYFAFEQFIFFKQWRELRKKAASLNIQLVGDIPIYVGWDSVDVWANQSIFTLDPATHAPSEVAGVPPDYFSKTGQRWGNPLYRWNSPSGQVRKQLLHWWTERFRATFQMVDIVRVDHFRGFESFWSIPAGEKTAVRGKWVQGPGIQFFKEIHKTLGPMNIIAEDLGEITPEVIALRDALGFPGMKILQFAFDGNPENSFLPYNFKDSNCVTYTGTHDNDTTLGWFLSGALNESKRARIRRFCNQRENSNSPIHRDLIYLALSSISRYTIFPLQDVLGFGNDCKMNTPGSKEGNWAWRCAPRFLSQDISNWLRRQCELFGRIPAVKKQTARTAQIRE